MIYHPHPDELIIFDLQYEQIFAEKFFSVSRVGIFTCWFSDKLTFIRRSLGHWPDKSGSSFKNVWKSVLLLSVECWKLKKINWSSEWMFWISDKFSRPCLKNCSLEMDCLISSYALVSKNKTKRAEIDQNILVTKNRVKRRFSHLGPSNNYFVKLHIEDILIFLL